MSGILYVVGTPIGNMSDITYRAVEILSSVDFICAEDTRVTVKLLNYYNIKKPLVSYHEHSARAVSENIITRIEQGENCAVVTDAGMPCISDPGEDLVKLCAERGVRTEVVPGPTAAASAVAVSGLSTSRFSFEGFLSVTKKQRFAHLKSAALDTHTLVFYEAPHKLLDTLNDMLAYFGNRRISICRELTKIHEEIIRTDIEGAIAHFEEIQPRGEFVLVVEGYEPPEISEEITIEEAAAQARKFAEQGMKLSEACKEAAKLTGYKKSEIYSFILNE
ncbi:MAG: 16S rRNA (cytidine(1402)-2'-O)-methyltransferase [Oscillospiraceae bacterium]|nr:16S rRNA (cytidine(1402)-2'-O)-methyltransferase [Oscillospiraceae bacterium]